MATMSLHFIILLLACWTCTRISMASPITTHTASSFERRQCIWNDELDDWQCDLFLPSLRQFVTRMQDAKNSGRATPENRVIFYANLFEPPPSKEDQWEMWNMIIGWLESRGIKGYYGALYALDRDWEHAQVDWIHDQSGMFGLEYGSSDKALKLYDYCFSQALAV